MDRPVASDDDRVSAGLSGIFHLQRQTAPRTGIGEALRRVGPLIRPDDRAFFET